MIEQLTMQQVKANFGDPWHWITFDGHVLPEWETSILSLAKLPAELPLSWEPHKKVGIFRCHKRLVRLFERALSSIYYDAPDAWATIDDFGGCYAFRANRRDRRRLSMHSWGIAIDLDVADNPQGAPGEMHPKIIEAFESYGFLWGGRFSGKSCDPMHMEFADLSKL
jgi:D-alanyl-D-alanine carboxypeptidase